MPVGNEPLSPMLNGRITYSIRCLFAQGIAAKRTVDTFHLSFSNLKTNVMKTKGILKMICCALISLIILQGCNPMSISVKGADCKMNGGFEIVKDGLPVNWHYYSTQAAASGDFEILCDKTIFKEGSKSLKFNVIKCDPIGGWHSPGFFEEFKVISGETYKVSFWVINQGCSFQVNLQTGMKGIPGISETVIRTKETYPEWKYFEYTVQIPKTNDNIRFETNIFSPGTIWIDDIRIIGLNDSSERTIYPYRGDEECK